MSIHTFQLPVYGIFCDHQGCNRTFRPASRFAQVNESGRGARSEAKEAGWQVPPVYGRGSRSNADLCPEHRTDQEPAK